MSKEIDAIYAPDWNVYYYFVVAWPFVIGNLIGLYLIHRIWINPPKMEARNLRLLRWYFGVVALFGTIGAWVGWWFVISSQEKIYLSKWTNPTSYEKWKLWPPPFYEQYQPELYLEDWLLGKRYFAWTDLQFRFWRFNIDWLLGFALLHIVFDRMTKKTRVNGMFHLLVGLAMLVFFHGIGGAIIVFSIYIINYLFINQFVGTKALIPGVWIFNIAVLVISDYYGGFHIPEDTLPSYLWFLSHWRKMHWHIYFKLSLCRLISYACDYHWAVKKTNFEQKGNRIEKYSATHAPMGLHSFWMYCLYLLNVPLYLAGPLCTYNSFVLQRLIMKRVHSFSLLAKLFGAVVYTHLMNHVLGFIYYNVCLDDLSIYKELDAWEMIAAAGFLSWFIYSKFYIIWTFSRAWAGLEGLDVEPNIKGFFIPCYTFRDFWRMWNVTMHHWVMRYIYRPLGGSHSQFWSVWIIFSFVGLWHDLHVKWLVWALFNCCCFCGETVFLHYFNSKRFDFIRNWAYYEVLASVVCAMDAFFVIVSNATVVNGFQDTFVVIYQAFGQHLGAMIFYMPLVFIGGTLGISAVRFYRFAENK